MLAIISLVLLLAPGTAPADSTASARTPARASTTAYEADEILWLARCIYSESDRAHEQRLVAWVVRNRVETRFRGSTYRDVVLEDRQFSAFNDPTPRRARILALTEQDRFPAWRSALSIAREVYHAPASRRPFPQTTRHFYSPVSMRNRAVPHWAVAETPLALASHDIDADRFRFYDGIDERARDIVASSPSLRGDPGATMSVPRRSRRSIGISGRIPRPVPPQQPDRAKR